MRTKALIVGALSATFLVGALAGAFLRPRLTNSSLATPVVDQPTAEQPRVTAPVSHRVVTSRQTVEYRPVHHRRSTDREILIVAGSSGAGAAIGAIAGGGKGAGIGALSGGIAGLVYDLATRNR